MTSSMNETQTMTGGAEVPGRADEINILDLLKALNKRKKLIVVLPLASAVLAAGISFTLPKTYQANTNLLPPQSNQSGNAALLAQLGGVASVAAGFGGLKNPNDVYIAMLKSRTVADRLIERFDLKKEFGITSQERLRARLAGLATISSGKDGLITIVTEAKTPKMAAALANGYVAELSALTKVLAVSEAARRRVFFEQQLEKAKDNLANAEVALKGALDTHGVISVDSESRAIVETTGRLRAQISAKEIELGAMQSFVTENNPNYRRVQEELNSLKAELSRLENGRNSGTANAQPSKEGLQNIKILRDIKYYDMLYQLLAKQYEAARLDEARDPTVIQVLDPAVEPERAIKPRKTYITIGAFAAGLFAAIFWVLFGEARKRVALRAEGSKRLA
ncbi:lipopolysaccharide biosynthesis protein [Massilia phosphatilytica]|nr:lipopolysaccharide biosynthesis protein [Massilia phosphatilytica]